MFDRLKNLLSSIRSQSDSVVGVDIGNAYLKVVQLRRKSGKAVLETYGSLALGPYAGMEIGRATHLPPDKLAEALRDILHEAHVTSKRAAFAIPFSSSLVTSMDMRVFDQKQLATVVSLEARKYIPVPISEVNLDWWIIPEEPHRLSEAEARTGAPTAQENVPGQISANVPADAQTQILPSADSGVKDANAPLNMKILIAVIHNEALNRYRDIVKDSGLESSFFEIELFSTIRALFPQDLEPHAVLDLGAGETKLYIIDRGLIRLSHIISHGGQDITLSLSRGLNISVEEAEKLKRKEGLHPEGGEDKASFAAILNIIFSETDRTLSSFEHKFGHKIKDLTLSGGGANLLGIAELARQDFSVSVEKANPFKQVEAPAFLEEVLKSAGPEFTVALGIAFRELQENQ